MQFSNDILYDATKETMSEFGDDGKITREKAIDYKARTRSPTKEGCAR